MTQVRRAHAKGLFGLSAGTAVPDGSRIAPDPRVTVAFGRPTSALASIGVRFAFTTMLALVVCNPLPPTPSSDPGRGAAEAYVHEYIAALNTNDPTKVSALTGKDLQDAPTRLRRFGGRHLHDATVSLSSEFERLYRVTILAVDKAGDRWRGLRIEWNGSSYDFASLPRTSPSQ